MYLRSYGMNDRISNPGKWRCIFLPLNIQAYPGVHLACCPMVTEGSFLTGKAAAH
jgi:hypothetical protein